MSISQLSEKPKKRYKKKQAIKQQKAQQQSFLSQDSLIMTTSIANFQNQTISSINPVSRINLTSELQNQSFLGSMVQFKVKFLDKDDDYCNVKDSIQDKDLLKYLKKYVKKTYPQAESVQILNSAKKPQIIFRFKLENKQFRKSLKDLLKFNKQLGKKQCKTIQTIFDKLYSRVGQQYHKVLLIVEKVADHQRVELQLNNKVSIQPLLYYQIGKNAINFAIFDRQMKMFEFSSTAMEDIKLSPKQQRLWTKFIKFIESKNQSADLNDQCGQYEAQSDQDHSLHEQNIPEISSKLSHIIATDITDYENQIEQLDIKCSEMRKRNNHKQKIQLQRLSGQVCQMNGNLQNFKNTTKEVEKILDLSKNKQIQEFKMANLLKKMILAKKQLESRLPIISRKSQIFAALDKYNLIIIQGETGSGKSTQLPQMLCQYYKFFQNKQKYRKLLPVLITQPRKLATRTVAQRVASEMQQKIGGFVDYATSINKEISKQAKIIFKLDSVVLDELTSDRTLSKYSCLIIDEAHQRTISIDVILGLIKQLLKKRKDFKVIVTSASLDAKLFQEYFKIKIMKVSGRLYPVQVIYRSYDYERDIVRKIEMVLKKDILISQSQIREQYQGDVLVFCTGVQQINYLCNIFHRYLNPKVFKVFGLHGRIAVKQQKMVFMRTKEHKIIFASRIAQTSITINGVKVVVDPGYDRQQVYDQKNRISSRKLLAISQSSAKQRAGRAGRTSNGYCFRLYSQSELLAFRQNKTPEIENMALDSLVLRLKSLKIEEIFKFPYIKKPENEALQKSVETLQLIGGLSFDGNITAMGHLLLQLHIEPFLGRAIVQALTTQYIIKNTNFAQKQLNLWQKKEIKKLSNISQIVVEILCMVMNSSNIFVNSEKDKSQNQVLDQIKYKNFSDEKGDFFFLQNIYDHFYQMLRSNSSQLSAWIYRQRLNKKTLYQVKDLVEQIMATLKKFHLDTKNKQIIQLVSKIKFKLSLCKTADEAIISCMVTSFCVNLSLYSGDPNIGYTLVLQKKPIMIYGTSTLSLQGLFPKWILCYDLKTNQKGVTFCSIAHEVDYKFLQKVVENDVFLKLNLKQAQKMNPFYQTIQLPLPTMILQEINLEYINRQNSNIAFYKYSSIQVKEDTNILRISFSSSLKISDIFEGDKSKKIISEEIKNYIEQKICDKKSNKMSFNLMSNIFLEMEQGFKVKNINFTKIEIQFIAQGEKMNLIQLKFIFQNINSYFIGEKSLKIVTINQEEHRFVKNQLEIVGVTYKEHKKQKNKQDSLNAKIFMTFYTGQLKNDPLFLYYGKNNNPKCQRMCEILQSKRKEENVKSTEQKYRYLNILCKSKFKLSKNNTGVKCFNSNIDAFMLHQALQYLTICGVLPYDFQIPYSVRQYRDRDHILAMKTESDWQKDILAILEKNDFRNINVKVKGIDPKKQEGEQNAEKFMKDELVAELTSSDLETFDELIKRFDDKQNIIGKGRIHFRYNFKQHITKVNKKVFRALYDQYESKKDFYESQYPQLRIETSQRIFGKVSSVFISCRCPNRQKLLEPYQKIKQIFTPFIIRLETNQYNFLYSSEEGEDFLKRLQQDFNYQIYFGFERKKSLLKVYCRQEEFQFIEKKIQNMFEKYHFCTEQISYKGKGLNNVISLIQNQIKGIRQEKLKNKKCRKIMQYSIIYRWRKVKIYGDIESLENIKSLIFNLEEQKPGSCNICLKNTEKPYKLFNCNHIFCWKCLGNFIQQQMKEENGDETLNCPDQSCNKCINPYDVKIILSAEEFQYFCMKKVKKFVNENINYFFCPTNSCQQIFQVEQIKKGSSFDCFICGKWFCSKCRQPHQHFTCKQWERKLREGDLAKFGFKLCKCGSVLQKQNRLRSIKCGNCEQYLCWLCMKGWKQEKICLNHVKLCRK